MFIYIYIYIYIICLDAHKYVDLPISTDYSHVHYSYHYHDFMPATAIIRWLYSDTDNLQPTFDTVKRILFQYQHMFQQVLQKGSNRDLRMLSVKVAR